MPVITPQITTLPTKAGTGSGRARNVSVARAVSSAETSAIASTVKVNQGRNGLITRPLSITPMKPAMNAQTIAARRSGKISSAHRIVPIESRKIGSLIR